MRPIQVGLLGIGTVGGGTFAVLQRNQEEIQRRAGRPIRITMVADLDAERARKIVGDSAKVVKDAREIIANPSIDIVVELIGGYGIARTLVAGRARNRSTVASSAAGKSAAATTRLTSPYRSASRALIGSPSRISSRARAAPMSRGSR